MGGAHDALSTRRLSARLLACRHLLLPFPETLSLQRARCPSPSSVCTRHRAVEQGKYRGSLGTTYQGKGRVRREVRIGQAGRGSAQGGQVLSPLARCIQVDGPCWWCGISPQGCLLAGSLPGRGHITPFPYLSIPLPAADSNTTRCQANPPATGMGCPLGRTWPMATAIALLCVDPTQSK